MVQTSIWKYFINIKLSHNLLYLRIYPCSDGRDMYFEKKCDGMYISSVYRFIYKFDLYWYRINNRTLRTFLFSTINPSICIQSYRHEFPKIKINSFQKNSPRVEYMIPTVRIKDLWKVMYVKCLFLDLSWLDTIICPVDNRSAMV